MHAELAKIPGLPTAAGVIGPMAPDLVTLEMVLRTVLSENLSNQSYDVIELPWNEHKIESIRKRCSSRDGTDGKLTFGLMRHDGFVRPHPPVQRALGIVADALLAQGHEVM